VGGSLYNDLMDKEPMIKIKLAISDEEHSLLVAALGGFQMPGAKNWGWTNSLPSYPDNEACLRDLVVRELMIEGKACTGGNLFHVTRKGCELLGMPEHRMELALDPRHRI